MALRTLYVFSGVCFCSTHATSAQILCLFYIGCRLFSMTALGRGGRGPQIKQPSNEFAKNWVCMYCKHCMLQCLCPAWLTFVSIIVVSSIEALFLVTLLVWLHHHTYSILVFSSLSSLSPWLSSPATAAPPPPWTPWSVWSLRTWDHTRSAHVSPTPASSLLTPAQERLGRVVVGWTVARLCHQDCPIVIEVFVTRGET